MLKDIYIYIYIYIYVIGQYMLNIYWCKFQDGSVNTFTACVCFLLCCANVHIVEFYFVCNFSYLL